MMRKKYLATYLLLAAFIAGCGLFSVFSAKAEASTAAAGTEFNVRQYGAKGDGKTDDYAAFRRVLDMAMHANQPITVIIPDGTYLLGGKLRIWPNTTIKAGANAVMRYTPRDDGNFLLGMHFDNNGKECMGAGAQYSHCDHGGYSQMHDVTIIGGIWDRNTTASNNSCVLRLCHGQNITLQNATFMNATNHIVNLSGTQNVTITGCTFKNNIKYTGNDKYFWGSTNRSDPKAVKKRFAQLEAVHLDHINKNGEPESYPSDGTACRSIRITNCTFSNVGAGAGTHNEFINDRGKYPNCGRASGLVISNCTFNNVWGYMADFCSFTNCSLQGKGTGVKVTNVAGICRIVDGSATVSGVNLYGMDGIIGPPVYIYNRSSVKARNIVLNGNGNRGAVNTLFYVGKGSTASASSINVTNGNKGKAAVAVEGQSSLTVSKAKVTASKQVGIYAKKAKKLIVKSSTVSKSKDSGIYAHSCKLVNLQKNNIKSSTKNGIYLEACTSGTIKGNKVASSNNCGIYMNATRKGTISNNTVSASRSAGIYLSGASKKKYTSAKVYKNTVKQRKGKPAIYLIGFCRSCSVLYNRVGGSGYFSKSKYPVREGGNRRF